MAGSPSVGEHAGRDSSGYGADISMESDFSSGAAETEEQPDVQEGTEITEEPETVTWRSQKNRKQSNQKMRNSQRGI